MSDVWIDGDAIQVGVPRVPPVAGEVHHGDSTRPGGRGCWRQRDGLG